ncbi:MAG: filamentous hemagglutinin N-terminal domain-containing protein [Phycisphaerales bacterium]
MLAVAGLAASAAAQPQGGQVVHGSATFGQNGATTVINASNGAIINYQSFNIPTGTGVQFIQPGSTSKVLNRVLGPDPSKIAGSLTANGIVYIVNPAGVFFANGALVDVGGIYAGAGRMSNADFLAGRDRFTNLSGTVENRGTIRADAVGLFGTGVANYGTIHAPAGMVALAAGGEVLVGEQQGNFYAKVSGSAPQAGATGVTQAGTIEAAGGRVLLGAGDLYAVAIDHAGATRARDIRLEGGRTGVVSVSGRLDASNAAGTGGSVTVLGEKVGLFGAEVDASGATGGGTVLVGGGMQGMGPERTAGATYISRDSSIRADATHSGNGGTIIVWSDVVTRSFGQLSARGGAAGGDGGFIETSGKLELHLSGTPDLRSPLGRGGTWLIDPEDLTITANPTVNVSTTPPPPATVFTSTGAGAELFVGDLVAALTGGASVEVRTGATGPATGGTITLASGVTLDFNGTGTNTLSLIAHRDIILNGEILDSVAGADALNLVLLADFDADGTGNIQLNNTVELGGGSFTSTSLGFELASTGSLIAGGPVSITASDGIVLGAGIDAGGADLDLHGDVVLGGDLTLTGRHITFHGTVDSDATARDLTLNTTGTGITRFNGGVGAASALDALTTNADGRTVIAAPALHAATMEFGDFVRVGVNTTLTATTSATFQKDVISDQAGQPRALTVDSPLTTFNGLIGLGGDGGGTQLSLIRTDSAGMTVLNGASVRALEVDFGDDVTLGTDVTVTATAAGFGGAVDSESGEANDLTINGSAGFAGGIGQGAGGALGTFTTGVGNTIRVAGPGLTAGVVNLQGGLVLTGDLTVTAGTSAAFRAIASASGAAHDLIVASPLTTFGGAIGGGTTSLGLLRTDAAGTTTLAIGVPASGFSIEAAQIDFQDQVQLAQSASVRGTTSITFAGPVQTSGPTRHLTVNSPDTVFNAQVGSGASLGNLIGAGGGKVTFNTPTVRAATIDMRGQTVLGEDLTLIGTTAVLLAAVNSQSGEANDLFIQSPATTITGPVGAGTGGALGTLNTDAAGTTTLAGNITGAVLVFNDTVQVSGDSILTGSTSVTFNREVDNATGDARLLEVRSPTTLFAAEIGSTRALGTLRTDAAGTTTLDTGSLRAAIIEFNDAVLLNHDTTIEAATQVRFTGTLDSATGAGVDLTITSPLAVFSGDVGSVAGGRLGDVLVNAGGSTTLGPSLTAATVTFEDTVTLNGLVTTTGSQQYQGPVIVEADSTLAGIDVTFHSSVNGGGGSGFHDLTVNTTANGVTTFNGPVGNTRELATLTTNADGKTVLAGATIRTTGAQTFNDPVVLALTTTLSAGAVTFGSTLDSDGIFRILTVNTTGTGTTTFTGAVGSISMLERLETNSDGTTRILGGSVTTLRGQVYNDAVVLGANTTVAANGVTFGSTLNSDTTADRTLVVNTSGNGVTTFVGAVGNTRPLHRLVTNADGRTRILAPSIRTSAGQEYHDAVAVSSALALDGTNISFHSTVDADSGAVAASLAVNSTGIGITNFFGRVGGTTPLKSLTTNADGRTRIGADITTEGAMTFGDAVLLFNDVTLRDTGDTGIAFGSTLDSQGGPRHLTLLPNPASQATLSSPNLARVRFTSPVGSFSPLASLTLGGARTTNPAAATFVGGLNLGGTPMPDYTLVINTTGAFTMGARQKLSVLGHLVLNSGGPATLGDISTLGNMTVNAPSIAVNTRPGGDLLVSRGGLLTIGRDGGVDFTSGGTIDFSQRPTFLGDFRTPAFATPDAGGLSATLDGFAVRSLGPLSINSMRSGVTVLDLAATGASSVNLAEAQPSVVAPVIAQTGVVLPVRAMDPGQSARLAEAGVEPRTARERNLPPGAVSRYTRAHDEIFFKERTDENGQPVREPQAEHIRDVLIAAWTEYAAAAKERADPLGFRAYVEAVPAHAEARFYLDQLRRLFDRLGQLGLTPAEAAEALREILAKVAFPGLTPEQLETAIMATQLGALARPGPAVASR